MFVFVINFYFADNYYVLFEVPGYDPMSEASEKQEIYFQEAPSLLAVIQTLNYTLKSLNYCKKMNYWTIIKNYWTIVKKIVKTIVKKIELL